MSPLEVRKQIEVARPRDEAFRLFTEGIGEWWPLRTHSVHGERARRAVFEPRLGGRIYEIAEGGAEAEWGRVLAWDPPHSFTMSWRPDSDAPAATEVRLRFEALADGRTSLELVHSGWEGLGETSEEARGGYDAGWDGVLGEYRQALEAPVR